MIDHQRQENYSTFRDAMMHKICKIGKRLRHPLLPSKGETALEEFWALKDINLEIKQGERVGIIGCNGAGKSTLLKILSRITEPTTGRIMIIGRVASLLEVGTGFHPELTGRENIFLNGAILGMSRTDIKRNFDEIVAFAEVEKFLDTPVKRYSSGMHVRLAFAVAAHLEPDILIIDEVLAVGDTAFQKKCLGKIGEVSKEGRTILFVSHNLSVVQALCSRVAMLHKGKIACVGEAEATIKNYLIETAGGDNKYGEIFFSGINFDKIVINLYSMRTLDQNETIRSDFANSESIFVELEFSLQKQVPYLKVGFEIRDAMGSVIFVSFHNDIKEVLVFVSDTSHRYHLKAKIPKGLLNQGLYYIHPLIGVHRKKWLVKDTKGLAVNVAFGVTNIDYVGSKRTGPIAPLIDWFEAER